jgi:hypothetical protein
MKEKVFKNDHIEKKIHKCYSDMESQKDFIIFGYDPKQYVSMRKKLWQKQE